MIEAGKKSHITWGEARWIFLDIGFASQAKSSGFALADDPPVNLSYSAAKQRILQEIKSAIVPVNLVIEAPLSACFNSAGNPTGRSIEKKEKATRYWYVGLGCAIIVPALYLVREIQEARPQVPVRLFEGFVSFKDKKNGPSDHKADVGRLRDTVKEAEKFPGCFFSSEQLLVNPADRIVGICELIGLASEVPIVIKPC